MLSDVETPELDSEDPPVVGMYGEEAVHAVKSQQSPKLSVKMTRQKESGNQEEIVRLKKKNRFISK